MLDALGLRRRLQKRAIEGKRAEDLGITELDRLSPISVSVLASTLEGTDSLTASVALMIAIFGRAIPRERITSIAFCTICFFCSRFGATFSPPSVMPTSLSSPASLSS